MSRPEKFTAEVRTEIQNIVGSIQRLGNKRFEFTANDYANTFPLIDINGTPTRAVSIDGNIYTAAQIGAAIFDSGIALDGILNSGFGGNLAKLL